jgi:hypothetical protein
LEGVRKKWVEEMEMKEKEVGEWERGRENGEESF